VNEGDGDRRAAFLYVYATRRVSSGRGVVPDGLILGDLALHVFVQREELHKWDNGSALLHLQGADCLSGTNNEDNEDDCINLCHLIFSFCW
jgi:hypothetical protein